MPGRNHDAARLATFNLLHGMGLQAGSASPHSLVEATTRLGADVLGLQEVDRHQERSGHVDQVETIAAAAGYEYARFVPALHGTPGVSADWTAAVSDDGLDTEGPTYGVGMVSRWPVRRWLVRRFDPAPFSLPLLVPQGSRARLIRIPDEPRVALAAEVESPFGLFTAVTCHLSFVPGYNWRQLKAITRWVASLPQPAVLLGDLNLPGALPRVASGWERLARLATYPSYQPRIQLDHILGLGVESADVRRELALTLDVSDHCALAIDVDLEAAIRRAALHSNG